MLPRFEIQPSKTRERAELNAWKQPDIEDKPSEWKWMQAVFARIDETPDKARYSTTIAHPKDWNALPLADLHSEDIDLFESAKQRPPIGTVIAYPLRILSLPGEAIRLGDRRMVRAMPGRRAQFEIFVASRYHLSENGGELTGVELDVGGGNRIHTLYLTRGELESVMPRGSLKENPQLLHFRLNKIDLAAKPESNLHKRFDAYLANLQDPKTWFLEHVVSNSGIVPLRRIKALHDDDTKISDWLKRVANATNPQRSINK